VSPSLRSGRGRAVIVIGSALLAGALTYGGHTALSSQRITDPADSSAALEPSPESAGPTVTAPPVPPSTPTPSTVRPSPSSRTPTPRSTPSPALTSAPGAKASRPPGKVSRASFRVEIPEIDAVLPVVPVGVARDGQMALPDDPSTAGWYRFGPSPEDDIGAAVISAHVDSRDEVGPLARLGRLGRGDRIVVTVDGTRVDYVVERVDQYAKTALDVDALFSRTGPARLHLVSCGGEWDPRTRHYEDNVVAIARRVS